MTEASEQNVFIIMWHSGGFEAIVDVNDLMQEQVFQVLAGEQVDDKISSVIHYMKLRARFNPQRNYEIYGLRSSPDIDKELIEKMFDESPQEIVDLIRSHGVKLHSDRVTSPVLIK